MDWHVGTDTITELSTGRDFTLMKHGLSRDEVRDSAVGTCFVLGDFPDALGISHDRAKVLRVVSQVSSSGDLFTYFASVYQGEGNRVILLDYVTASPDPLRSSDLSIIASR